MIHFDHLAEKTVNFEQKHDTSYIRPVLDHSIHERAWLISKQTIDAETSFPLARKIQSSWLHRILAGSLRWAIRRHSKLTQGLRARNSMDSAGNQRFYAVCSTV